MLTAAERWAAFYLLLWFFPLGGNICDVEMQNRRRNMLSRFSLSAFRNSCFLEFVYGSGVWMLLDVLFLFGSSFLRAVWDHLFTQNHKWIMRILFFIFTILTTYWETKSAFSNFLVLLVGQRSSYWTAWLLEMERIYHSMTIYYAKIMKQTPSLVCVR